MLMATAMAAAAGAEADPPPPEGDAGVSVLVDELHATVLDALRRATTRAEHVRLIRIQSLVQRLTTIEQ